MSCFEKVNSGWKNVPKQSRKTVFILDHCLDAPSATLCGPMSAGGVHDSRGGGCLGFN